MPYLNDSAYQKPSSIFRQAHLTTIYSGAVKRTDVPAYERKTVEFPDGDFVRVDQVIQNPKRAVLLFHGLEGHSRSSYNNTCANYFLDNDFSVFAWNNRSCGGQMNKLPQLYHHGSVEDVNYILEYVLEQGFEEIYLMGFSLGGSQILNFLGQKPVHTKIKAAVAISAPISLKSSVDKIEKGFSRVYLNRFMKRIRNKVIEKAELFPDLVDMEKAKALKTFDDLAKNFLVPVHGYDSPDDFYYQASPLYYLDYIRTPVLILNAWDDPIIGEKDFPVDYAKQSDFIYLETPKYGGHCSFLLAKSNYTFSEVRALEFFKEFQETMIDDVV